MTIVAVMQPYLFPYVGYYQMAAMADHFVFLDDANFIVRGFVNRNSILLDGALHRFVVPVANASQNRTIREHSYPDRGAKLMALIERAYRSAAHRKIGSDLVERVFMDGNANTAETNALSIRRVFEHIGIERNWYFSSTLVPRGIFKGSRWIIEICRRLNASVYLNLPGGRSLYSAAEFESQNISLRFVEPRFVTYPQGIEPFASGLSVLDAIMNCNSSILKKLIDR